MLLRLDTDEGVSGYGEPMFMPLGFRWPVVAAMIEDLVEQAVLGHDPYNAEELMIGSTDAPATATFRS